MTPVTKTEVKLTKGTRVSTKFGLGVVTDDYWRDRDRFRVRLDDGTEHDFGSTSLRALQHEGKLTSDGVYIASKTTHGSRWRELRATGYPIISTWIDEAEAGATSNWPDLWHRCVREASTAAATIVYREPGEVLKGAFVEMGAALSAGRTVFAVGCDEFSVRHHMRVVPCDTLDEALELARETCDPAGRLALQGDKPHA